MKKKHNKFYYIWWGIKLDIIRRLHNTYKSSTKQNELLIREGILSKNGHPIVCISCGHDEFKKYNEYYEECGIIEYSLKCERCEQENGTWSYGAWMTF